MTNGERCQNPIVQTRNIETMSLSELLYFILIDDEDTLRPKGNASYNISGQLTQRESGASVAR